MLGVRNIGSLPDHDTMSVHTSSVRIRKDSAMIVRPVAVPLACSTPLPAHNSTPHAAADAGTLAAVQTVLQEISQPFINLEVLALVRQGQPLIIDVDLTGRPVSPTSTTYPDADFGWMDDAVAKGYRAAITTLSGGSGGRVVLSSQRYPGRTKSAECLRAAVRQMEQAL